jgi:hypothetical protein
MINKLFESIDNLLADEKEQRLKDRLGNEIKNQIFTDEIIEKLDESDFSGIVEEEEEIVSLFSTIFPVFVKKDDVVFRLYKHKIEVDLSDEMSDRYIYIFSDGRLTSGIFECFRLYDDEYVYGIKRIIEVIPLFREAIIKELSNFEKNKDIHKEKMVNTKNRELIAEKNFNELMNILKR